VHLLDGRPRQAAELIDSNIHWLQSLTDSDEDLRRDLSCVYAQSLQGSDNIHDGIELTTLPLYKGSICSMLIRHSRYMSNRSLSDALRSADEFVASFPGDFEAHASLGEVLLALDRAPQARTALEIAYLLLTRSRMPVVRSMAHSPHSYYVQHEELKLRTAVLYAQSLLQANNSGMARRAGHVLWSAISGVVEQPIGPLCELLSQAASLQCGLDRMAEAFVTRLLMRQYCGEAAAGNNTTQRQICYTSHPYLMARIIHVLRRQ